MKVSEPIAEWLNYHHLRYFHAVATEGSLSKAAEKLSVSQPSMSTQIKLLETNLGERLFRRSGRNLTLTEFGRLVLTYADDIFALGQELVAASRRGGVARTLRLQVGVVDSFPKLLSHDILRPALQHRPSILLSCHEGRLEDLLGQLATHRLDAVLSDDSPSTTVGLKTFTHALGSSGVAFCASPALVRSFKGRFPQCLNEAPALLPMPGIALRRDLEAWFVKNGVKPRVVAEFQDAALAKIAATEGAGLTVVPTIVLQDAVERYGFEVIGRTQECRIHLFIITPERRIEHPVVASLVKQAEQALTARSQKKASRQAKKSAVRR